MSSSIDEYSFEDASDEYTLDFSLPSTADPIGNRNVVNENSTSRPTVAEDTPITPETSRPMFNSSDLPSPQVTPYANKSDSDVEEEINRRSEAHPQASKTPVVDFSSKSDPNEVVENSKQEYSEATTDVSCGDNHPPSEANRETSGETNQENEPRAFSGEEVQGNMDEQLNLGIEYLQRGDHDAALELFNDILTHIKATNNNREPRTEFVASVYHNLGVLHSKRYPSSTRDEALDAFHNSIYIRTKCIGSKNDPFIAMAFVQLGFLFIEMEDHRKSRQVFHEACKIRTNVFGLYHPLTAKAYNNLGIASLYRKKFLDAVNSFRKALSIQRHLVAEFYDSTIENHHYNSVEEAKMDVSYTLCNMASLVMDFAAAEEKTKEMERYQDEEAWLGAEKALEEALTHRINCLGEDHQLTKLTRDKHETAIRHNLFSISPRDDAHNAILGDKDETASRISSIAVSLASYREYDTGNTIGNPPPSFPPVPNTSGGNIKNQLSYEEHSNKVDDPKDNIYTFDDDASHIYTIPYDTASAMGESKVYTISPSIVQGDSVLGMDYRRSGAGSASASKTPQSTRGHRHAFSDSKVHYSSSPPQQTHNGFVEEKSEAMDAEYGLQDEVQTVAQMSLLKTLKKKEITSPSTSLTDQSEYYRRDVLLARTLEDEMYTDNEEELSQKSLIFKHIPENIKGLHESAEKFFKEGKYEKSLYYYNYLLPITRHYYGEFHPLIGLVYHEVGMVYLWNKDYPKAFDSFERAVMIRKEQGQYHPSVSLSLNKLGVVKLLEHEYDLALKYFEDALNVRSYALGNLHPTMARIHNKIGCVYLKKEQLQLSRSAFEQALDVQRNAISTISTSSDDATISALKLETAGTLINLGYLYRCRRMFKDSTVVLQEASKYQEEVYGCNHMAFLSTLDSIAETYLEIKSSPSSLKALEYYQKIFDILNKKENESSFHDVSEVHRASSLVLHKMSKIYKANKDYVKARDCLQDAKQQIDELLHDEAHEEEEKEPNARGAAMMRSSVRDFQWMEKRRKSERLQENIHHDLKEMYDRFSHGTDWNWV